MRDCISQASLFWGSRFRITRRRAKHSFLRLSSNAFAAKYASSNIFSCKRSSEVCPGEEASGDCKTCRCLALDESIVTVSSAWSVKKRVGCKFIIHLRSKSPLNSKLGGARRWRSGNRLWGTAVQDVARSASDYSRGAATDLSHGRKPAQARGFAANITISPGGATDFLRLFHPL